jgi:hypothetical protein
LKLYLPISIGVNYEESYEDNSTATSIDFHASFCYKNTVRDANKLEQHTSKQGY